MAAILGVSKQTLKRVENGHRATDRFVVAVSQGLKVSIDEARELSDGSMPSEKVQALIESAAKDARVTASPAPGGDADVVTRGDVRHAG